MGIPIDSLIGSLEGMNPKGQIRPFVRFSYEGFSPTRGQPVCIDIGKRKGPK